MDLGCSPGSWLAYAADITGQGGLVVGIDLKPVSIQLPAHVTVYKGDLLDPDETLIQKLGQGFQAVISDMAPNTTGNKDVDAARSFDLCEAALNFSRRFWLPMDPLFVRSSRGNCSRRFQKGSKRSSSGNTYSNPRAAARQVRKYISSE